MISAKIIADSVNQKDHRLTTLEVVMPRIILAEFNTHRMFSRNSASSRAIPVERQIEMVMHNPFIPLYWGRNQKGMQAHHELSENERAAAEIVWLYARDKAVTAVNSLMQMETHKQIVNRLLEPFMWHTVVVSSTEWGNFFHLRKPPGDTMNPGFPAQPEMQQVAIEIHKAMHRSNPILKKAGDWHLPYVDDSDPNAIERSVARCARVSYLRQGEDSTLEGDLTLFKRLSESGHLSPFEHVAQAIDSNNFVGNFKGWNQYRKWIANENDLSKSNT